MNRRTLLSRGAVFFGAGWLARWTKSAAAAPPVLGNSVGGLTYKEQLEKGLKARRPSDFTFIQKVVDKIDAGEIPQKTVNETFDYARKQSDKYPFIYFQFALRKRAEKLGVTL